MLPINNPCRNRNINGIFLHDDLTVLLDFRALVGNTLLSTLVGVYQLQGDFGIHICRGRVIGLRSVWLCNLSQIKGLRGDLRTGFGRGGRQVYC